MSDNTIRTWYRPTNTTTYLTFFLSNPSLGKIRLTYAPDGWDKAGYGYPRSKAYGGIFRKYSINSLGFVKDGKAFLERAELEQGFEAEITLEVWEWNPNTIINELVFSGDIQLVDKDEDELMVKVPVDDSSFERKIISRQSVPVIVTKKTQGEVYKSLDGKVLPGYANEGNDVTLGSRIDYFNTSFESNREDNYAAINVPAIPILNKIDSDYTNDDVVRTNESVFKSSLGAFYINSEAADATIDMNGSFNMTVAINPLFFSQSDISVKLYIIDNLDEIVKEIDFGAVVTFLYSSFNSETYSVTGIINVNDIIPSNHYIQIGVFDDLVAGSVSKGVIIDFSIRTQSGFTPQINIESMLIHELISRIGQVITSENLPFYSELLGRVNSEPISYTYNGDLSLLAITNGALIRGFPMTNGVGVNEPIAPLSVSLKDAFTALNNITPIGMGVKLLNGSKVFFIEELKYFFDTRVVLFIDNATEIKEEYDKDKIPNQVGFGYAKFESDEKVDGFYDYNTKSEWSNAIISVEKKISSLSKISASNTSINEARRITKEDNPTTDSKYDGINYMIDLVENTTGNAISNGDAELGLLDWSTSSGVTVQNLIGSNRFVLPQEDGGQKSMSQQVAAIPEPIFSFSYAVISTIEGLTFTPTFQITATKNDSSRWSLNSSGGWVEGVQAYAATSIKGVLISNFQSMNSFGISANEILEDINYITVSFDTAFLSNQVGVNQLIIDDVYTSDSAKYKARTIEGFDYIRGIVNANDSYNIRLSPARSLVNHGFKLRAPLEYKLNTEYVFSNSDKISTLVSKLTDESSEVAESSNVLVNDLEEPIYGVELVTFDALLTASQKAVLNEYHADGKPKIYSLIAYRENTTQEYKHIWINDLASGGFQSVATIEGIPISKYITVAEETFAVDDDSEIFTDDDNEQFTID